MKRIIAIISALVLAVAALSACGETKSSENKSSSNTASEAEQKSAEEIFEETFASRGFRGAVYMTRGGEEIYSGGAGKANKDTGADNSADVVYHIASLTKQFTAAAILKLCEENKMSTDDTLSKYFHEYKTGADITVHNLLSMQSGIPDFVTEYDENGNETGGGSVKIIDGVEDGKSARKNRDALRAWIFSQKLLFGQGERYCYSNSNYFLLGEIIEKVSGTTYYDYLKTNFFQPLDMTTAGFAEDYSVKGATVAKGYHNIGLASETIGYNGASFGSANIMASPKDMYKWTVALHSGKVLNDEMYQKMTTVQSQGDEKHSPYGYGIMINESADGTIYYHSGNIPRFTSVVMYSPKQDMFIAVMSNYSFEGIPSMIMEIIPKLDK